MTARLPVTVSIVQTLFYMYAYVKKSSPGSTQLPTSRHLLSPSQPLTVTSVTHIHTYIHTHTHKIANRYGAPRPPMTDVGTETAFRLDQRKHFQKSKHPLRSEVS